MKITCPVCKTSYQVSFPEIDETGLSVECAKCHNQFLVKRGESNAQTQRTTQHHSESGSTTATSVETETARDDGDPEPSSNFKDDAPDPETSSDDENAHGQEQIPDESLDEFLDQLIQEEMSLLDKEGLDMPPPDESADSSLSDTDLEDMFDELIEAENVTETSYSAESAAVPQETDGPTEQDQAGESSEPQDGLEADPLKSFGEETDVDEGVMDQIWEEAVADGETTTLGSDHKEADAVPTDSPAEPAKEATASAVEQIKEPTDSQDSTPAEQIASDPTDEEIMQDLIQEMDAQQPEPENPEVVQDAPSEETVTEDSSDDVENEDPVPLTTDSAESEIPDPDTEEGKTVAGDNPPTPVGDEPESTMSDETMDPKDPQDVPEENSAADNPADNPDEMSEEDLWAQAFADQEKTEQEQQEAQENPTTETAEDNPDEMSEEDLWAQAFADQEKTEQEQQEAQENPTTETAEDNPDEMSEEDLWAQAFADQEKTEQEQQEAQENPTTETAEDNPDEMSEEDLWAQAFADQEKTEQEQQEAGETEVQEVAVQEEESDSNPEVEELEALVGSENLDAGDSGDSEDATDDSEEMGLDDLELDEAYEDYEEDDFPTELKKKKFLGIFPQPRIPETKTGKLIAGGSVVALLLTLGGVYFAMQTFAPAELNEVAKAPETSEEMPLPQEETPEAEPKPDTAAPPPANETKPPESAPPETQAKASEPQKPAEKSESGKEVGDILKEMNKLGGANAKKKSEEAVLAALSPRENTVTLSTVLPVAYNATDLRILSFTMVMTLDNAQTTNLVQDSIPVFEKVMITTVENFLGRKFYNDVLYVREKLQKRLEIAMNKIIEGGEIKKVRFKEFDIQ